MLKAKKKFFYDFKSQFLTIFSSNYWHRLVLKILFPDHIFSKISKYCTENLHFPSISKYYVPPTPLFGGCMKNNLAKRDSWSDKFTRFSPPRHLFKPVPYLPHYFNCPTFIPDDQYSHALPKTAGSHKYGNHTVNKRF